MLNKTIGLFFIRVLLGVIFLMQGYGKVFSWGMDNVYNGSFKAYESTFLPDFSLYFAAYFTSFAELIGGFLLMIGLLRNYALYTLALVLLIVSFGHGLSTPIWGLSDVFFRAALLIALLLLPEEWDKWQVSKLPLK